MTISIVIPSYNGRELLEANLPSVMDACAYWNYQENNWEVIVVNDGSQDDTRYIAKQYPVKYIEQVNKGLASARNTGIMNMAGDWFFPLDADDKMLENCLAQVSNMIENTDADIIAPSFKCFGKYQDEIILMPNPELKDFEFVNNQPQNRIGYFSAIKKESLLEVGGYSPRMIWGWEDLHLTIDLLSQGKKIVTIPEVLILYRTKEHSMIHEANAHATELMSQIYKDFPNLNK